MLYMVSIIIPVYNQENFLAETLHSILKQTYSNWECVLINDGSTDNSVAIINQFVALDNRFQLITSENKGVSHARNLGLKQMKGDFILFVDGDDLIHPEKLQKAMVNFQKNENLSIVFNQTNYFQDTIENTLFPMTIDAELLDFNNLLLYWNEKIIIPIHSAIIKKILFTDITFNTHLTAQEDWLVWLQVFQQNPKVVVLDEVLSYYRKHNSSRTQAISLKEDHFKALEIFENYLTTKDYKTLMLHQIKRYYNKYYESLYKLNAIKESRTYKTALLFKRIALKLKIFGLIKLLSSKFLNNGK